MSLVIFDFAVMILSVGRELFDDWAYFHIWYALISWAKLIWIWYYEHQSLFIAHHVTSSQIFFFNTQFREPKQEKVYEHFDKAL